MFVVCLAIIFKAVNWGQRVNAEMIALVCWISFQVALILKTIPATSSSPRPLFPCVLSSCMLLYLLLPPYQPMVWVISRWKVQSSRFVKLNIKHWLNLLSKLKGNSNCLLSKCQLVVSSPHFVSPLKLLSQTPSFAVLLHVPLLLPLCSLRS